MTAGRSFLGAQDCGSARYFDRLMCTQTIEFGAGDPDTRLSDSGTTLPETANTRRSPAARDGMPWFLSGSAVDASRAATWQRCFAEHFPYRRVRCRHAQAVESKPSADRRRGSTPPEMGNCVLSGDQRGRPLIARRRWFNRGAGPALRHRRPPTNGGDDDRRLSPLAVGGRARRYLARRQVRL